MLNLGRGKDESVTDSGTCCVLKPNYLLGLLYTTRSQHEKTLKRLEYPALMNGLLLSGAMVRTERVTVGYGSSGGFFFRFCFLVTSVKLVRFSVDLKSNDKLYISANITTYFYSNNFLSSFLPTKLSSEIQGRRVN